MTIRDTFLPFGAPNFSDLEIDAVTKVLRSGWIGQGSECKEFENELASYTGAEFIVGVNSCTSALFLSLKALGIGHGDEVIVPSLTWCSTANAVLYTGATPVFCDIDSKTMLATPELIAEMVTPNTRAVIIVHYGGLAADVQVIKASLPRHVDLVEDAAHALGACYPDGLKVGSSGNLTCFSFYANKNISIGDGGAIAVPEARLAEKLRLLSNQGLNSNAWKRYTSPMSALTPRIEDLGYKMNLIDLLACIGRVQLARQNEFQGVRKKIARYYIENLSALNAGILMQPGLADATHAKHLFVIQLPTKQMGMSRNDFLLELRSKNIGASIHYPPLHRMTIYERYTRGTLVNTEEIADKILTLPIGARMNLDDAAYVVDQVADLLAA
jgi:dTDP-4-amino-4,6-dideoxygalactose transaminase